MIKLTLNPVRERFGPLCPILHEGEIMAPRRVLKIGGLNIQTHPHSPERYVELFRDLNTLGESVPVLGSEWGTLGYIKLVREKSPDVAKKGSVIRIRGGFYRYLNIDPNRQWLDLIERRPLDIEAGEAPPPVPDHLKPNLREVTFLFYPGQHRLFFDLRHISHNLMQRLMDRLCHNANITKKFHQVDVIVESSDETIDRILKIPRLTRLEIFLTRSNPDDISEATREIELRMDDQRLTNWTDIMTSKEKDGIAPDTITRGSMEFALSHGKINAVGYDGDERIVESTKPHPAIERESFDTDTEAEWKVMKRLSERFLAGIRRRLK